MHIPFHHTNEFYKILNTKFIYHNTLYGKLKNSNLKLVLLFMNLVKM